MVNLSEMDFSISATEATPQGAAGNSGGRQSEGGGLFLNVLGRAQILAGTPEYVVSDVSDQKVLQLQEYIGDHSLPEDTFSLDKKEIKAHAFDLVSDSELQNAVSELIASDSGEVAVLEKPDLLPDGEFQTPVAVNGIDTPIVAASPVSEFITPTRSDEPILADNNLVGEQLQLNDTQFSLNDDLSGLITPTRLEAPLLAGSKLVGEQLNDTRLSLNNSLSGIDESPPVSSLSTLKEATNNGVFDRVRIQVPNLAMSKSAHIDTQLASDIMFGKNLTTERGSAPVTVLTGLDSPIQQSTLLSAGVSSVQMLQQARTSGWTMPEVLHSEALTGSSDPEAENLTQSVVRSTPVVGDVIQQSAKPVSTDSVLKFGALTNETDLQKLPTTSGDQSIDTVLSDELLSTRNITQGEKTDYTSLRTNVMADVIAMHHQGDKNMSPLRLSGGPFEGTLDRASSVDVSRAYAAASPPMDSISTELSGTAGMPASQISLKQPGWDRSLGANIAFMLKENINLASIKVKPAELGPMNIQLSVQSDQLNVSIAASHTVTRETLEASLPRLREQFTSLGFSQVNVNIEDSGLSSRNEQRMANGDESSQSNRYIPDGEFPAGSDDDMHQARILTTHNGILDTFA